MDACISREMRAEFDGLAAWLPLNPCLFTNACQNCRIWGRIGAKCPILGRNIVLFPVFGAFWGHIFRCLRALFAFESMARCLLDLGMGGDMLTKPAKYPPPLHTHCSLLYCAQLNFAQSQNLLHNLCNHRRTCLQDDARRHTMLYASKPYTPHTPLYI